MSDKLYQIKNGAVTLYVNMKYNGINFEFVGLTVDGDSNFYQPHVSFYDADPIDGRPRVGLDQYLLDKFKSLADKQLKDYLDQNIGDMSIYDIHDDRFEHLWRNAGCEPNSHTQESICCRQAIDGVIGFEVGNNDCLYDLASNKVIGYSNEYSEEEQGITPMRIFFGNHLNCQLALEQYKRGFSPPFYIELVKLNHFLRGKKSVKLVMKDGAVHDYKHHSGYEVFISSLLCFDSQYATQPFSLNNSYDLRPRFSSNRAIAELDYLQHGRERYYIDSVALKQFSGKDEKNG